MERHFLGELELHLGVEPEFSKRVAINFGITGNLAGPHVFADLADKRIDLFFKFPNGLSDDFLKNAGELIEDRLYCGGDPVLDVVEGLPEHELHLLHDV